MPLPAPPDGSPIADLSERQRWLSRIEIAYRLPAEGLLIVGDAFTVSINEDTLTARAGEEERERTLTATEELELASIWSALWFAPPTKSPTVFLRYRGIFRTVGADDDAGLMAWLGPALKF